MSFVVHRLTTKVCGALLAGLAMAGPSLAQTPEGPANPEAQVADLPAPPSNPLITPPRQGSAEIRIEPNGLRVSGFLDAGDDVRFQAALNQSGARSVRFDNCRGGNLQVASAMTRLIMSRKIHTVAAGYVYSACALTFLGGTQRKVERSPLKPSLLMLHGAYDVKGQFSPEITETLVRWLQIRTRGLLPAVVRQKIAQSLVPASGVYFWLPVGRAALAEEEPVYRIMFCSGKEAQQPDGCEEIGRARLDAVGVVPPSPPRSMMPLPQMSPVTPDAPAAPATPATPAVPATPAPES